ncbi:hypothetical protein HY641_03995 [Candidatus Woesearchaeota archaeon]|nr:hypothetical protein [Candidatus Woesearchaeota archaeon]
MRSMLASKRGIAEWLVDYWAIFATIIVIVIAAGLFATLSLAIVKPNTLTTTMQSWEAHATLLAYLRTPLPENLPDLLRTSASTDALDIIESRPELWEGKTLAGAIGAIGAAYNNDASTAQYLLEPIIQAIIPTPTGYLFVDYPPHQEALPVLILESDIGGPLVPTRALEGNRYDLYIRLRGFEPREDTPFAQAILPMASGETVRVAYSSEVN